MKLVDHSQKSRTKTKLNLHVKKHKNTPVQMIKYTYEKENMASQSNQIVNKKPIIVKDPSYFSSTLVDWSGNVNERNPQKPRISVSEFNVNIEDKQSSENNFFQMKIPPPQPIIHTPHFPSSSLHQTRKQQSYPESPFCKLGPFSSRNSRHNTVFNYCSVENSDKKLSRYLNLKDQESNLNQTTSNFEQSRLTSRCMESINQSEEQKAEQLSNQIKKKNKQIVFYQNLLQEKKKGYRSEIDKRIVKHENYINNLIKLYQIESEKQQNKVKSNNNSANKSDQTENFSFGNQKSNYKQSSAQNSSNSSNEKQYNFKNNLLYPEVEVLPNRRHSSFKHTC